MRPLLVRLLLVVSLVCAIALTAEAAAPSIESLAPGVGQRGTDFELRLAGAGLDDARDLMLYLPGITCMGLESSSPNELLVRLRSSAECPLGSHPFRVRTSRGLSELRTFRVTRLPIAAEVEPNGTQTEAQIVAANVTITGVLEAGDVDCFQLTMRRGDRLSAEVEAVRLGGPLLDTVLSIFGPDGNELVSADDTPLFRQDPFVSIIVPVDGRYVVQVREINFEGDENSRYALHLGSFPRPAFVYPAGGPAGRNVRLRFGGDASGDFDQEFRLPELPDGKFALFAERHGQLAPTPNPFRVSPFENVLESDPNNDSQSTSGAAADLPVAFNGIIERPGDKDCFRFRASHGSIFEFEAFACRIGSPLDSLISIFDAAGNLLVSNDDDGSHDSRLVFAAPQSGEYALCVEDKRREGGPNFVYRVEATEVRPRVTAFLPRPNRLSQERQTIVIPQGNRVVAFLGAQRTAFDGEVGLVAEGLPVGVSMSATQLAPDRFWTPVVFESRADAPIAGALVDVLATGRTRPTHPHLLDWLAMEFMSPSTSPPLRKGGQGGGSSPTIDATNPLNATPPNPPLRRGGSGAGDIKRMLMVMSSANAQGEPVRGRFVQVVDLVGGTADTLFHSIEVDRLAVAVVDESPLSISLEEPKVALAIDGTIVLKIEVERQDGFDGQVDIAFPFLPPWVDGPAKITVPADQSSAIYTARALPQAEPRTWSLCAEATPASAPVRRASSRAAAGAPRARKTKAVAAAIAVSSKLVRLRVTESPVTGTIGTVAAEQGRDLTLVCEIKRAGQLPPRMVATLEGLPNRVSADAVMVGSDDERIEFTVKVEPQAPVGTFASLVCRLTGAIDGQEVSYCVGRAGVLKIEPAGALVTDESGRPLSPLEVLRRSRNPKVKENAR